MRLSFGNTQTTIRMTVVTVFVLTTALTAALAIGLQYYFGQANARRAAADLYAVASSLMASEYLKVGENTANTMDLLSNIPTILEGGGEKEELELLTQVLQATPLYHDVFIGRADGSYLEVVNLDSSIQTRRTLRAHPTDRWVVTSVTAGEDGRVRHYRYLDENLTLRITRTEKTGYDPRENDWYSEALASGAVRKSPPHLFPMLGIPGETLSKRIGETGTVVGMRLVLSRVSELLTQNKFHVKAEVFLFNRKGDLFASSLNQRQGGPGLPVPDFVLTAEERAMVDAMPVLVASNEMNWPPFDYAQAGRPMGYSVDVIRLIAEMTGLTIDFVNGHSWPELVELFLDGEIDLLHSVILTEGNRAMGLLGADYINTPFGLATTEARAHLNSLEKLNGRSLAVPRGWEIISVVQSRFPGISIVEVDNTQQALEWTLAGKADAALDTEIIMRFVARHYFLEGLTFHPCGDMGKGEVPDKLHILVSEERLGLRSLLDRAIHAIGSPQREYLDRKWLDFDSETALNASSAVPSQTLIDIARDPVLQNRIIETTLDGEPHFAFVAPTAAEEGGSGPLYIGILTPLATVHESFLGKVRLSILITAGFLVLLLPLSWFFANPIVKPIRRLAGENDKVRLRRYDEVERIKSHVRELDELSESMVNMVASIQAHELAQRKLMDSFIELIAQAIDDKSPYTGGHCKRVPELALMLADRASRSDRPPFRDFRFETEDQWREYRIAAWLHDCGKITTPEHIVDKGSKLETIYNRIHEVRMRFEVLWRDAQIEYMQGVAEKPDMEPWLAAELKVKQQKLQEDFAFVAECNVGGEFLGPDKLERLNGIAGATWLRYFNDRLGLSPLEELGATDGPVELPATEKLLCDDPRKIIARTSSAEYAPELGISMEIPENLSNLGELHNLSVSRGTLTEEDRFRIKEHMISTIKMLESLPFPDELKNVPRYASTHHETMAGNGYPRGLGGEELSVPERLLAVADVFEALTASDRPYKKAKTIREALGIMHNMVLGGHIDGDCFDLFIEEKVYLDYGKKYLAPEQIDEVDVSEYLTT